MDGGLSAEDGLLHALVIDEIFQGLADLGDFQVLVFLV